MFEWYVRKITWIKRIPNLMDFGWGNGYVKIPKGHWLYEMNYDAINEAIDYNVHGGLTYSGFVDDHPGYWVVGFDTAHLGDTLERWPKSRVEAETIRLSTILFNLKKPEPPEQEETLDSWLHCEVCGQVEGKCQC